MEEAEREVNEDWGREWRSANLAYGSSVCSLAQSVNLLSSGKREAGIGDLHVLLDDDAGNMLGI